MSTRKEKAAKKKQERLLATVNEDPLNNTLEDTAGLIEEKPQTISEMLAPMRETIKQDKTDAVKMQKYYALTDALGALGKMGGTAIGGAIGGNMMDSAPIVGEYQPSRGYVEAFEKAKRANERLKSFDEKSFNLLYDDQRRKEEREYKEQTLEREKKWQKDLVDYKAKIDKATAEGNLKLKAELEAEAAARTQQYVMEQIAARNAGDIELKKLGQDIQNQQYQRYGVTPVRLKNGRIVSVPNNYYEAIKNTLINGDDITEKNVERIIRSNPEEYLSLWGIDVSSPAVAVSSPTQIEQQTTQYVADSTGGKTTTPKTDAPVVFDTNKITEAEARALSGDYGIHGIPLMKAGGSGYTRKTNVGTMYNQPSTAASKKKTEEKKESKYSKEDLEFMSQFE